MCVRASSEEEPEEHGNLSSNSSEHGASPLRATWYGKAGVPPRGTASGWVCFDSSELHVPASPPPSHMPCRSPPKPVDSKQTLQEIRDIVFLLLGTVMLHAVFPAADSNSQWVEMSAGRDSTKTAQRKSQSCSTRMLHAICHIAPSMADTSRL